VTSRDMKRLEKAEHIMVRCARRVTEVVRHGRLRWFGHLERKNEEDCHGCHIVESLRLLVLRVEVGAGRHGLNV